jgi:hypothetical protein
MTDAYDHHSRPERPLIGPQARYAATSHDIAMGDGPDNIWFDDASHSYRAGLEWVLFNLEQFDEPSRHWVLAATAWKYGLPFDVLMGGML